MKLTRSNAGRIREPNPSDPCHGMRQGIGLGSSPPIYPIETIETIKISTTPYLLRHGCDCYMMDPLLRICTSIPAPVSTSVGVSTAKMRRQTRALVPYCRRQYPDRLCAGLPLCSTPPETADAQVAAAYNWVFVWIKDIVC